MTEVKKNETEHLWKTLETWSKEWDMYKTELEKYKQDNNWLISDLKDRYGEIEMLWRQVFTLENQDDELSTDKKQELIRSEIDHQVKLIKS